MPKHFLIKFIKTKITLNKKYFNKTKMRIYIKMGMNRVDLKNKVPHHQKLF